MFRSVNSVIGRVLNHDKPAGYVFTEADFEPKGTRPGLVAGIPAGKRAMRIPVERIPGLVELQPGDRFDLVATAPIDAGGAAASMGGGIYARQLELQARLSNWQKQATVRVVVQSGDVVEPMRTRQVPVANNTMTNGLVVRTKPVQEVVIAVLPEEVSRLTEAMAVGEDISCVPRSGRPEDPHESITPDSMPVSPFGGRAPSLQSKVSESSPPSGGLSNFGDGFTTIETINGSKRDMVGAPVKR
jgi:Flp pilus assembly protein CpaB